MESTEDQKEMLRLLREQNILLKENNKIVHILHRWSIYGLVVKIVWYALLIGFPFALYFYIFEPYFTAMGADYDVFEHGVGEIPGIKAIQHFIQFVFGNK